MVLLDDAAFPECIARRDVAAQTGSGLIGAYRWAGVN